MSYPSSDNLSPLYRLGIVLNHIIPLQLSHDISQLSRYSTSSTVSSTSERKSSNDGAAANDTSSNALSFERSQISFNVREMTYFLDGGRELTELREMVAQTLSEDPVFIEPNRYEMTRSDLRRSSMAKIKQCVYMVRDRTNQAQENVNNSADSNNNTNQSTTLAPSTLSTHSPTSVSSPLSTTSSSSSSPDSGDRAGVGKAFEDAFFSLLSSFDPSWSIRIGVHYGLFASAVNSNGSEEQRHHYDKLIKEMRIIGCFGMTEMGHGSNVKGLETTATYVKESDEFEVHSPTLTSTKWWIGMAGQTATHCAVFARLIIKQLDYGVHTFIVQIRDLKTGRPLPTIQVGDMSNSTPPAPFTSK